MLCTAALRRGHQALQCHRRRPRGRPRRERRQGGTERPHGTARRGAARRAATRHARRNLRQEPLCDGRLLCTVAQPKQPQQRRLAYVGLQPGMHRVAVCVAAWDVA